MINRVYTHSINGEFEFGDRFKFGKNWSGFLNVVNEERIKEAEKSLMAMLGVDTLEGKSFIDVGSGSGLFSLAATRMGALVHSFDIDTSSVWCTTELRRKYFPESTTWTIEQGSVLNSEYIESLGKFDIVYSWGVLHHTGDLWKAMELISLLVMPRGSLFIAIYNDQGRVSERWKRIKRTYCSLPDAMKPLIHIPVGLWLWMPNIVSDFARLKPFEQWRFYYKNRGMSPWHDIIDWVGGYPFEVAKPEEVISFWKNRGFRLKKLVPSEAGNNQYVFCFPK